MWINMFMYIYTYIYPSMYIYISITIYINISLHGTSVLQFTLRQFLLSAADRSKYSVYVVHRYVCIYIYIYICACVFIVYIYIFIYICFCVYCVYIYISSFATFSSHHVYLPAPVTWLLGLSPPPPPLHLTSLAQVARPQTSWRLRF